MPPNNPEELYTQIQSSYTDADVLEPELAKKFSNKLKLEFLQLALLPGIRHMGSRVRSALHRLVNTIQKHDMFDVYFEGEEALKDVDLILGNHQGPNSSNGGGQGGLETFLMWEVIPPKTRIVLKNELVKGGNGFKSNILARTLRKLNPIVVNRPDAENMSDREAVKALREEQQRISKEVFRVIDEEEPPVLIFPEGTRSADGSIRQPMSPFSKAAITDYVLPRMREGKELKTGALISDTLQVFPNGLGGGADLYRKSLTIRGVHMNTDPLCEQIRERSPNLEPSETEIKQFAKIFSTEVKRLMQSTLCSILNEPK